MKKIGKRLLAGCLMSILVLAQIRPEIAYAQEEMTDVALQAESAVQETEETDIADIEADNQIAAIDDSEVPGSDDIESTETESMETETETETEIEMHTITGVQDLAEEDRRIDIAYADKPSLEELVEVMPKTMNVYLDGGKEVYTVPVTWYCVTGDYEDTEGHYYQFSPLFDETQYQLSADLDLLTEVPYISVFLYADDGISLLSSNSESSNTTIVFNYLVDELKMNSAAACGVLANIYYESGFDPHMEGDNNTSYGICQWHADRKTNLINYCKSNNLDYTTLEGQLAFLKYELVNSYSKIYNYMLDEKNTADGVKISWNKVKGASEYYVYRKGSDGKYTRLGKSSGNTLNYTDKTAESGSTYTYTVRAVSGDSIGTYKSTSTIYCLAYPVISSVSNVQNGIHISWNKVKGASEYYLYRKGSDGVYSRLASVSESTLSYTDKKAVNGEKYVYTLRAVNKNTISAYHSLKGIVCLSVPVLDKAASKQDGMHISWKSVKGADAYYIYRKTGSGSWQRIGTTNKGTAVSYTDGSAVGGVTYSYTVRACKDSSLSGYDRKGLVQRYSQSLVNYKTIEKVNYRTGAGTSYNIGGTFNKGTAVKVVANYSVKADGYTWYKIYYNGRYYYAANKYLKKA